MPPTMMNTYKRISAIFFIVLTVALSASQAQNATDRALIQSRTNLQALKEIATAAENKNKKDQNKALSKGIPLLIKDRRGNNKVFHSFDVAGNPIYAQDENLQIARISNVEPLWRGAESGLDLTGSGIEVGLWEIGVPLGAHQDLLGRIIIQGNESVSSHATHTACSIAGSGTNHEATGMAPKAKLRSNTSNNDESEMAVFAMQGGIISNHSYRFSEPEEEAAGYGVYNNFSEKWDMIAYNAPYYTICKSGGNSRNDGYNEKDLGFDLMYNNSCSKNILVVAATKNIPEYLNPLSVVPASFSNHGPTDDWRIKPDITTNGTDIFSCDNGNTLDYGVKSGTSMSSAAVAGMVALLQEHFHSTNGVYMRASTTRALIFATAKEAGSYPGPDFRSGWGLIDAGSAAYAISDAGSTSIIEELTLSEGDSIQVKITVDGKTPLRACIAWNDPSGTIFVGEEDNTTAALVNDLDIRLVGHDKTYEPWRMTPNETADNFLDPAEKGDNFRDNSERIDVDVIPEGSYTLQISHKGQLNNPSSNKMQDFSLVITGLQSSSAIQDPSISLKGVSIYPMPVTDGNLNIDIDNTHDHSIKKVLIYSISGALLYEKKSLDVRNTIDVSPYQNGTYLLILQAETTQHQQLITIMNN